MKFHYSIDSVFDLKVAKIKNKIVSCTNIWGGGVNMEFFPNFHVWEGFSVPLFWCINSWLIALSG